VLRSRKVEGRRLIRRDWLDAFARATGSFSQSWLPGGRANARGMAPKGVASDARQFLRPTARSRLLIGRSCRIRKPMRACVTSRSSRRCAACSPIGSPRSGSGRATSSAPRRPANRNVRRALKTVGKELGIDLASHDFRRSLASFLIVAARVDEAAVTGVMGTRTSRRRGASTRPTGARPRSATRSSCASSPRPGSGSRAQLGKMPGGSALFWPDSLLGGDRA
jgi:ribosomal protein S20